MFKISVADLDSPSYFVAVAAADLGFFRDEGVEVELLREYGGPVGPERLRDGTLDRMLPSRRDRAPAKQ